MAVDTTQRKTGMVRVLGGFSESRGIETHIAVLQTTEFCDASRIQISNELSYILNAVLDRGWGVYYDAGNSYNLSDSFCRAVLNNVFCERVSSVTDEYCNWRYVYEKIHSVIMQATYNEVLDAIQYICDWLFYRMIKEGEKVFARMNRLFEREKIGYRFVNGCIIPITDEHELNALDEACNNPIDGCRKQIQKAVSLFSNQQNPDYKNCIKESISAVESICQVIVGDNKATLGDALKKLEENGVHIHPSLKQGFQKIYGYTSDQGGIRHAEGMFESDVTFEEAKFMLVSCSAFINYLIAEYGKRGN